MEGHLRHAAGLALAAATRSLPLPEAADLLGAHRSADRVHRLRGVDLVGVDVETSRRPKAVRIRMDRLGGRDQVAQAIADGGLWGFEPPLAPLFAELACSVMGDVFDVGANTGLYSLVAAAANPTRRVHAVEPLAPVVALLEANLALNRIVARRVRVHELALSAVSGTASLYLPPASAKTSDTTSGKTNGTNGTNDMMIETSASLDPTFKEEIAACVKVTSTTFDALWRASGRPAVGLVKIDTEGTEHLILRAAEEVIASSRPIVICEVLPRAATGELTERLARSGYVDVRLREDVLLVAAAVRFDPDAWNHAFVPQEALCVLECAGRTIGLETKSFEAPT
jgi:FkbM family methyltransferase